jgi:hypothetical protein
MPPATRAGTRVAYIDLEFNAGANGAVLLGDIASSLVSLDELLRDLGSIAAYPSSVEFREIQIIAIEMRHPLTVKLSLLEISPDAIAAFRELCRDVILFHERRTRPLILSADDQTESPADQRAVVMSALQYCCQHAGQDHITEQEVERILGHLAALKNAQVALKRIVVKDE